MLAAEGLKSRSSTSETIRPLDLDTILQSVVKTHRAIIVEEDWPHRASGARWPTASTTPRSTNSTP